MPAGRAVLDMGRSSSRPRALSSRRRPAGAIRLGMRRDPALSLWPRAAIAIGRFRLTPRRTRGRVPGGVVAAGQRRG